MHVCDHMLSLCVYMSTGTYRVPMQRVLDELSYLRDEFRDDEAAQVLKEDASRLVQNMIYDEQVGTIYRVTTTSPLGYLSHLLCLWLTYGLTDWPWFDVGPTTTIYTCRDSPRSRWSWSRTLKCSCRH